jgi:hypothetical protein
MKSLKGQEKLTLIANFTSKHGNSIVVNVLVEIFKNLFKEEE